MNDDEFITIEGNKAIARLNELDVSLGKSIGGCNVYYNLRIERISEKEIKMAVWNGENTVTAYLVCSIEDVPYKLTYKKTPLVRDLIDIFDGESLPPLMDKRLKITARLIQQKWIDSDFKDFTDSCFTDTQLINLSGEEIEKAKELLRKDILKEIDKELETTIKGEEGTRLFLLICFLQAYTKRYPAGTGRGESSAGKSYLFKNIFRVLPPENYRIYGKISRTALERVNLDTNVKILYIQEARGAESASESIRLSSNSDGGMIALITNKETGKVDELKMRGLSIFTTTTSLEIHNEDATRNIIISLDESIEQTEKVVNFQGEEAEIPDELKEALGLLNTERINTIRNAIRLLNKDIVVVIPYQTEISKVLDKTKLRIKRDNERLIGHIITLALLRQYQRQLLEIDDKLFIIADIQDFRDAVILCEKQLTRTYYNTSDDLNEVYNIIKKLESESPLINESRKIGLHTSIIQEAVITQLTTISAGWLSKRLNNLVENGALIKNWINDSIHLTGYYYHTLTDMDYNSIFKSSIADEVLKTKTEKWRKQIEDLALKKGSIVNWIEPSESEKYIDCVSVKRMGVKSVKSETVDNSEELEETTENEVLLGSDSNY